VTATDIHRTIDAVWRIESARIMRALPGWFEMWVCRRARAGRPRLALAGAYLGRKLSMARCFAAAISQAPSIFRDARFRHCSSARRGRPARALRPTHISNHPGKARNDSGRLDPPNRVDGAMDIGSRHGYPSHHLQSARASPCAQRLYARGRPVPENFYALGSEVFRSQHLANFGFALPPRPVFLV